MAAGILRIQCYAARQSAPMAGVSITVTGEGFAADRVTGTDGTAADLELEAPASSYSLDEANTTVRPYAVCALVAEKPGYQTVRIEGIQIFSGQTTLAPIEMVPANARIAEPAEPVVIPPHPLFAGEGGSGPSPALAGPAAAPRVLTAVVIPKTITVHLGAPTSSARNVTVSFRDYIANVASSEVYPTWPEQALRANIHCQISLALNRIYTEWYPSRGFSPPHRRPVQHLSAQGRHYQPLFLRVLRRQNGILPRSQAVGDRIPRRGGAQRPLHPAVLLRQGHRGGAHLQHRHHPRELPRQPGAAGQPGDVRLYPAAAAQPDHQGLPLLRRPSVRR